MDDATADHEAARQSFRAGSASQVCTPREAVIDAATARGWQVEDLEIFPWHHRPAGLTSWLRVTVAPPLPFPTATENAEFIGFDPDGCATLPEWSAC